MGDAWCGRTPTGAWRSLRPARRLPGLLTLKPSAISRTITHLDAGEAATLGSVLARVTGKLKALTGADLVYVYVFGERVPHLHFNLAPHHQGDALVGGPGLLREDAEPLASEVLRDVSGRVEEALRGS